MKEWLQKGYASLFLNYTLAQNNFSAFETKTNDYLVVNLAIGGKIKIGKNSVNASVNANNLFDKTYVNHLSRLKTDGIYNIGRNIIGTISFDL